MIFNAIYEYPLMLALAGILRPRSSSDRKPQLADFLLPWALGAGLVLMTSNISGAISVFSVVVTLVFATILFSFSNRPLRFGLGLAAVFLAGFVRASVAKGSPHVLHAERSFFGVYQVTREAGSNAVTLYHGTTLHGAQAIIPARRLIPITYYHRNGPVGDVFAKTPAGMSSGRRVAVVGLGTGTLACYGRPGEQWTFYEIDPAIVGISRRFFSFLRDCPPSVRIILGDARLTLRRARPDAYDMMILDAFSSDAIPVHLLTREALRGYFALLRPNGVIAVHISNRHVDLSPVLGAGANDIGVVARIRRDGYKDISVDEMKAGRAESDWVILARSMSDLGAVASDPRWVSLPQSPDVSAWTDDFSNVFRVFHWR